MEGTAAAVATPVGPASGRLRWLDLLPVLAITVAGVILVFIGIVVLVRLNRGFYRENLETIGLTATLAVYLAFGAGIAVALRRIRAPLAFLGLRPPRPSEVGMVLLLLVPWYVGVLVVSALSSLLFNGGRRIPGNAQQLVIQRPHGIGLLLLALLVTSVAAPVCEEIFFRGMLFRLIRERAPLWLAVLLSAVAFGLAHASPTINLALLPVFVYMGAVLATLYQRTGSLTNNIMLHAFNNAVGTATVFLVVR